MARRDKESQQRSKPNWFVRGQGFLGRHLATRWKLTLWYAAFYILTLAIVGAALPPLVAWQTNRIVDSQLRQASAQIAASVASAPYTVNPPTNTRCSPAGASYCPRIHTALKSQSEN